MKSIDFYKEDGQWYADVPQHTKEENEMVFGADKFLDAVSLLFCNGKNRITIFVSDNNRAQESKFIGKLIRKKHDENGATYIVTGEVVDELGVSGFELWLCNVVHTVFGEHPESIYIHDIFAEEDISHELDLKSKGYRILREMGLEFPKQNWDRYDDEEYQKLWKMYEKAYWELHKYVTTFR